MLTVGRHIYYANPLKPMDSPSSHEHKPLLGSLRYWLEERPFFVDIALPAITVLFGLEMLRVLVPGLTWVLGDRFGLGAIELGGIALLVFGTSFLASGLGRLLDQKRAVMATAGGLGLVRLLIQVWWGDPLVSVALAILGIAAFVTFVPLSLDRARAEGRSALTHLILGLLAGLALDTAIHGAFSTYDPIWQRGVLPVPRWAWRWWWHSGYCYSVLLPEPSRMKARRKTAPAPGRSPC